MLKPLVLMSDTACSLSSVLSCVGLSCLVWCEVSCNAFLLVCTCPKYMKCLVLFHYLLCFTLTPLLPFSRYG
jgi:hypothetical protein